MDVKRKIIVALNSKTHAATLHPKDKMKLESDTIRSRRN